MLKQRLCALAILASLLACGEGPSKKTPRVKEAETTYVPYQAPTTSASKPSSGVGGAMSGSTTLSNGATAPGASAAAGPAFALSTVNVSGWESNCYRFSPTGDYSKKYWSFKDNAMTSLLLKYSDASCTTLSKNIDGTSKVWSTWVIGDLTASALIDNWAIVSGNCSKGCTGAYKTALRASSTVLNEGSKIGTSVPEAFNTAEGKYTSYSKQENPLDLEALASSLSQGAAGAPSRGPTAPVSSAPVVVLESTGLGLISSLSGQTWSTCYLAKNTEGGVKVDRGFKRTLSFKKGAELKADSYSSDLVVYGNVDCTGDVLSSKSQLNYSNLVVTAGPLESWLLVSTQTCETSCNTVRSLMKLPTAGVGLQEAGENKTAGSFYTDTPRIFSLNP